MVIVRDHFLTAPNYHWAGVSEGLPHCVTQAMFFGPSDELRLTVNDLGTTFAEPKNYHQFLTGVAVYARDTIDTPASELRLLTADEQAAITREILPRTMKLYAQIAAMTRRDRIMSGVQNYTAEPIEPLARAAGLWKTFRTRDAVRRAAPADLGRVLHVRARGRGGAAAPGVHRGRRLPAGRAARDLVTG